MTRRFKRHAIATLLALSSCSLPVDLILPEWADVISAEWLIGQENVHPLVGDRAYEIFAHNFRWKQKDALFNCDGVLTNGCFWSSRDLIAWNTNTPTVVRIEAEHAILWKLGHPEWITFPHRVDR